MVNKTYEIRQGGQLLFTVQGARAVADGMGVRVYDDEGDVVFTGDHSHSAVKEPVRPPDPPEAE